MIPHCMCEPPRISLNPRTAGSCGICGKVIEPDHEVSDRTFSHFFDKLRVARPERDLEPFLGLCARREREWRDHYGLSYLAKDNMAEAYDEAADGANYCWFEYLRMKRVGREQEVVAELLEAADHFEQAYEALNRARLKVWREPGSTESH